MYFYNLSNKSGWNAINDEYLFIKHFRKTTRRNIDYIWTVSENSYKSLVWSGSSPWEHMLGSLRRRLRYYLGHGVRRQKIMGIPGAWAGALGISRLRVLLYEVSGEPLWVDLEPEQGKPLIKYIFSSAHFISA